MENIKKKSESLGIAILLAIFLYQMMHLFFSPKIRSYDNEFKSKTALRNEYQELLSRKPDLESEWKSKEQFLGSGQPDEALNLWVKKVLDYGQSHGLIFEKMEPGPMKEKNGRKEIRLFLFFHSNIHKFSELLFYLRDSEPFTEIETLSIKSEEDAKSLAIEVTLKKVLK